MVNPMDTYRAIGAVMLSIASWSVAFIWFSPLGWALASVIALIAIIISPPLPPLS